MKLLTNTICASCGGLVNEAILLEEPEWEKKPLCAVCLRDILLRFLEFTDMTPEDFDLAEYDGTIYPPINWRVSRGND